MKNLLKKTAALAVALTFAAPVFTACRRKGGDGVISKDDPWYDFSSVEIDRTNNEIYDYIYTDFVGMEGDEIVAYSAGSLKVPDDFDYENADISDIQVAFVSVYGTDGELLRDISIESALREANLGSNAYLENVEKDAEGYYVSARKYSNDYSSYDIYRARIDIETGEIGRFEVIEEPDLPSGVDLNRDFSDEGIIHVGEGYDVHKYWYYGDGNMYSYALLVTDLSDSAQTTVIDLRTELPGTSVYDISSIIDIGNDKGLVIGSADDGNIFLIIDFSDMSVSETDEDMSWIEDDIYNMTWVEGIGSVITNSDGIYKIDYEGKTMEPVFEYSSCNANRYILRDLTPVKVEEDRIILTGSPWIPQVSSWRYTYPMNVYVLTRASSNPNAGKEIISVSAVDGNYSYPLCEAVSRFNESNEDYFAVLDQRYDINEYVDGEASTDEEYGMMYDSAAAELGNQLAIDVMSGDGPDIIINASSYTQLDSAEYLTDLSDFAENELGSGYFGNIFEAARVNGGLYQMPLSFYTNGILTDRRNAEDGQIGFTYDQYVEFVDEVCNGDDPVYGGQMNQFLLLFSMMTDLMETDDGAVNYDNEAFRALAEYVKDHVNEEIDAGSGEEIYYDDVYGNEAAASYRNISSMTDYVDNVINGDKVFLGLPTFDGRGPIIRSDSSAAISAQTEHPEGCMDFLRLLMSEDIQLMYAAQYGMPLSRAAFTSAGQQAITDHNDQLDEWYSDMTDDVIRSMGVNPARLSSSSIDEFEQMIGSLSGWYTSDGAVNAIIREEMPAYFAGQKNLDQVIATLENRVQTVISERS